MLERLADLIRPLLNGEAAQAEAKPQAPAQPAENTEKATPAPSNEVSETPPAAPQTEAATDVGIEAGIEAVPDVADETPAPAAKPAEKPRRIRGFQINEQMMSIMGCGADDMAEILSALGYQSFQPKQADAPIGETDEDETDENRAVNAEIQGAASGAEQAEAPPLYWRPRARHAAKNSGKNSKHAQKRSARKSAPQAGADNGKPDKNSRNKPSRKNTNGKNQNRKQASKQAGRPAIDSNSPFAVLSQLQNKGKELQDE